HSRWQPAGGYGAGSLHRERHDRAGSHRPRAQLHRLRTQSEVRRAARDAAHNDVNADMKTGPYCGADHQGHSCKANAPLSSNQDLTDEDAAEIGRAFMERLPAGYSWSDSHAEYLTVQDNKLHD